MIRNLDEELTIKGKDLLYYLIDRGELKEGDVFLFNGEQELIESVGSRITLTIAKEREKLIFKTYRLDRGDINLLKKDKIGEDLYEIFKNKYNKGISQK